jgi:hypothetical protein
MQGCPDIYTLLVQPPHPVQLQQHNFEGGEEEQAWRHIGTGGGASGTRQIP